MSANKNADLAISILKNIFLPYFYDDPFIKYRLAYLLIGIILLFWAGLDSIFRYPAYLLLIFFLVSIPIHYYERYRMFKLMRNRTMPGS